MPYRRLVRTFAYAAPTIALIVMLLSDLSRYCDPSGNSCSRLEVVVGELGTVAFVALWFTLPVAFFVGLHHVVEGTRRGWRRRHHEA